VVKPLLFPAGLGKDQPGFYGVCRIGFGQRDN
jgi:hypothetical protein